MLHPHRRYRLAITGIAGGVIVLGLLSRSSLISPASFVGRYSGDALWALLVYLMFRWLFPAHSVIRSAVYASVFALAVETSQLVHAPWIDALRSIRLVHLLLGSGFVWSDLLCYAIAIAIGACLEWTFGRRKTGSFLHTSTETGACAVPLSDVSQRV